MQTVGLAVDFCFVSRDGTSPNGIAPSRWRAEDLAFGTAAIEASIGYQFMRFDQKQLLTVKDKGPQFGSDRPHLAAIRPRRSANARFLCSNSAPDLIISRARCAPGKSLNVAGSA